MKEFKASEVMKILNYDSEEVRSLITKVAKDRNISEEYIKFIEKGEGRNNSYLFKESSLIYIQNYLFLYGIFGRHPDIYNVLNHRINRKEIEKKFKLKMEYLEKKYFIYKNLLHNKNNLLEMLSDEEYNFYEKVIEDDNKLLSVKIIEELEEQIDNTPEKLVDLIKAQIEVGDLISAKDNVEKIIKLDQDKLEAYSLKATILSKLMETPIQTINQYKIVQENMESSSGWNTCEEMIQEKYTEVEKLQRNKYSTNIEIYQLLKKSKGFSNYDIERKCKKEIFSHIWKKYFYLKFVSLELHKHLNTQKDMFKEYKKSGHFGEIKEYFPNPFTEMVLDIIVEPSVINFKGDEAIQIGIEALHFYFMMDFKKYIEYADFYFGSLKEMDLSHISPQVLSSYLSHCHKKTNYNSHMSVFQEHLYMNLSEAEIIEFNKKLSEKVKEEAEGQNEARALNLIKVSYFKGLYKDKKYEELTIEMEKSLDKLKGNPENYVKVAYAFMELIFKISENNLENKKYDESIKNIEKLLVIDREMYKKYSEYNSPAWKSETQHVEGARWTENEDILGNWFESDYTIETKLKELVYTLEDFVAEEGQNLRLEKIKKYLNV